MKRDLSFDDVLVDPRFSFSETRNFPISSNFLGMNLKIPIISANMDSITGVEMANAMGKLGCVGALHRFSTIYQNVEDYNSTQGDIPVICSIGVGEKEYDRAMALFDVGCTHFLIDVAHGANINVVKQYDALRERVKDNAAIIVGNFANAKSIEDFIVNSKLHHCMDAVKLGIGGGSLCTTRIVTGCGRSTLASILDCNHLSIPIIADGGIRTSGDIFKSYAAGASAVMLGGMLAGTEETPGETISEIVEYKKIEDPGVSWNQPIFKNYKKYRGSASQESYIAQGKEASHRTPEGEATLVPYKGSVANVIQQIDAALHSAMSYIGVEKIEDIHPNSELIEISNATIYESSPHGKK